MYATKQTISVTTAADGTATAYSAAASGRVLEIRYVKNDFADGVDFTITRETEGGNVWVESNVNASKTVRPFTTSHDTTGVELGDSFIYLVNERLLFSIASGGDTKSGSFVLTVG